MYYKTRTYVTGAWDEDADAITQLYKWKESNYWSLDFVDAHEFKQARDTSNPCNIKKSLCDRMEHSKLFVLVVGPKTKSVNSGSCRYCSHYFNNRCYSGGNVSFDSFIDYECSKAVRDHMRIIVLYNSNYVFKDLCPEVIRNYGIHIPIKNSYGWDYYTVKNAFERSL